MLSGRELNAQKSQRGCVLRSWHSRSTGPANQGVHSCRSVLVSDVADGRSKPRQMMRDVVGQCPWHRSLAKAPLQNVGCKDISTLFFVRLWGGRSQAQAPGEATSH